MAGINRLGKGPAKPGTMRPQDPNKYKTMDIFSEGTEGDKDYARMVQDIEDTQQNHMGWLFSRGAFDKGDLLYLRDEEEKRRFAEQELRDSELRSFARMRNKAEAPRDFEPSQPSEREKDNAIRSQALQRLIRIKPSAKVKRKQEAENSTLAKKIKAELGAPEATSADVKEEDEAAGEGLAGLLGGYGSESEDEEAARASTQPRAVKSELRELPLPDIVVKREVKAEPSEPQPDLGVLALEQQVIEEEVDYEDQTDSDSSDD